MAVLFGLAAGPAERDALLDMAGTATALLALGDRLAVIEADEAVAAELVNQLARIVL